MLCEAWLDFPEEDLDRAAQAELSTRASALETELVALEEHARQGTVLHDGLSLAIAGPPNAGKSSLLNRLAGHDAAIVTDVPGTTRDTIRERLSLDGVPVEIVDTAGLRPTQDPVEREGVRRARREIDVADHVLWVADIREGLDAALAGAAGALPPGAPFTVVLNKVDLVGTAAPPRSAGATPVLEISALTGEGIRALVAHLQEARGLERKRRRHVQRAAQTRGRARARPRSRRAQHPRSSTRTSSLRPKSSAALRPRSVSSRAR